jgi:hypothetical protein
MILPNHTKKILYLQHLCFSSIIIFHILIDKLCPIIKISISKFYTKFENLSKVVVIIVFRNKGTLN